MLPVWLYLCTLFVAPQLWVPPFIDWRTDFIVYPLWLMWLAGRGRLGLVFQFRAQDWCMAGFVLWVIMSMYLKNPPSTAGEWTQKYIKWMLLYRMVAASIDSEKTLRKVIVALMTTIGFVAVQAWSHLHSADGLGWAGQSFAWVDPSAASAGIVNRTRWIGIFDGPGVFCVMFTIAVAFALHYVAKAYDRRTRIFAMVVLVPLFAYATFATGSRGGLLSALAVLGCWVISRYELSVKRVVTVSVLGMAGLMVGPSYLTQTKDSSNSAQHRVDMWAEGIEMAETNPVLGIGRGNFANYTGLLIAHNSGIELMGETGFMGLFMWLGVSYMGFRNLAARTRESKSDTEKEVLIGVGLCIIGYMVSSLFVTLEFETLYFMLGMTAGVRNFTKEKAVFTLHDVSMIGRIIFFFYAAMKMFVMTY